jgi:hypothetical protein
MGSSDRRGGFAVLTGFAVLGGAAFAQSTLPPTNPTALAPPAAVSSSAPAAPSAPEHQAQVGYQLGQLTVIAENSSLNQILREVAQKTGMKITGGVIDQRVYGTYGPASPSVVLGTLLQGTGANMILRMTAANEPTELVLTPMQGRPTPPSLNTSFSAQPQPSPQGPAQGYPPEPRPGFTPVQTFAPSVVRPQYVAPPPGAVEPSASPVTPQQGNPVSENPQSPNGVPTPQQIYERLQQLQQQRAQPANGSQ